MKLLKFIKNYVNITVRKVAVAHSVNLYLFCKCLQRKMLRLYTPGPKCGKKDKNSQNKPREANILPGDMCTLKHIIAILFNVAPAGGVCCLFFLNFELSGRKPPHGSFLLFF